MQEIYTLPLFVDATDDEIEWLIQNSYEVRLEKGEYFFREGEPARRFYVVLEGELQITRRAGGREGNKEIVLGTTPRGIMGGETFLLSGTPAQSSAQALYPCRLMVFDQPQFLAIFTHCPSVGVKILRTAAERMHGLVTRVKQQEKMAALGKLSAGLAHELNNPAAAAKRSTSTLRKLLPSLQRRTLRLNVAQQEIERLLAFVEELQERSRNAPQLSTLDQSEREDEIADWLDEQGFSDAGENVWEAAATFVNERVTIDDLEQLLSYAQDAPAPELLAWLCETLTALGLLTEIAQGAQRISDLVGAIKSYTYMDRGALQDVDIHKDLDNTLVILRHKLMDIQVVREYDPELPPITARGDELNQVWTNLIDNAIDALNGKGTITLKTRRENGFAMVEVMDDGPGIPPEVQTHIFEPFFTTKEVGSGTGLGLDISYRIVQEHDGTIEIDSRPGQTRFIVRLPLKPAGQEIANEGTEMHDADLAGARQPEPPPAAP